MIRRLKVNLWQKLGKLQEEEEEAGEEGGRGRGGRGKSKIATKKGKAEESGIASPTPVLTEQEKKELEKKNRNHKGNCW